MTPVETIVSQEQACPRAQAGERRAEALARLAAALQEIHHLCPELPVRAIRWMHVKHPLHEVQEAFLRGGSADRVADEPSMFILLKRAARCVLFGGYLSACLLRLRLALRRPRRALQQQPFSVIARTVCFSSRRPEDDRDFYFGDLQQRLADAGVRMLLLCGDASNSRWTDFARGQIAASGHCRMPELALVPPWAALQMAAQQVSSCLRLRRRAARLADPLARRVCLSASRDCLLQETALNGLCWWIGRAAARTWHPRAFLTLYEGHAWEACLWQGVKAADPSCRTVGYQHTAIFRESLSMLAPIDAGAGSIPEVALGLGEIPLQLLRPGHVRHRTRLVRFGGFRAQAMAAPQVPEPERRTVLVTPEGIPSETRMLFLFALACARRLPNYTFVLRCHPQVPMAEALRLVPQTLAAQPNIVLSDRPSIDDDFRRASLVLYRGSSSVLYAMLHGLLPVCLQPEGTANRDPLYSLPVWRRHCASSEEFGEIADSYGRMASDERHAEWAEAVRYVQAYTGPVGEEAIQALLSAVGLEGSRQP